MARCPFAASAALFVYHFRPHVPLRTYRCFVSQGASNLHRYRDKFTKRKFYTELKFLIMNIMIEIYIEPPKQRDVYFPDIGVLSLYNDTLWYKTYTAEMDYEQFIEDEKTYEEAMKPAISLKRLI